MPPTVPPNFEPPWTSPLPSAPSKTYFAHCHCKAIKYTVTLSPPLHTESALSTPASTDATNQVWKVVICNCSACVRNGSLMVHPFARDVKFTAGEEYMSTYLFGNKTFPNYFCKVCGSSLGNDLAELGELEGGKRWAINVRMFKGVELDSLQYKKSDGKAFEPAYEDDE